MYRLNRLHGRVVSVRREPDNADVAPNNEDFLAWNAKQETPLDLSDKPPEPPVVDADLERVKEILSRFEIATAAEKWEAVGKYLRKRMNG